MINYSSVRKCCCVAWCLSYHSVHGRQLIQHGHFGFHGQVLSFHKSILTTLACFPKEQLSQGECRKVLCCDSLIDISKGCILNSLSATDICIFQVMCLNVRTSCTVFWIHFRTVFYSEPHPKLVACGLLCKWFNTAYWNDIVYVACKFHKDPLSLVTLS